MVDIYWIDALPIGGIVYPETGSYVIQSTVLNKKVLFHYRIRDKGEFFS